MEPIVKDISHGWNVKIGHAARRTDLGDRGSGRMFDAAWGFIDQQSAPARRLKYSKVSIANTLRRRP